MSAREDISPNGKLVATTSYDKTVWLKNTARGYQSRLHMDGYIKILSFSEFGFLGRPIGALKVLHIKTNYPTSMLKEIGFVMITQEGYFGFLRNTDGHQ